MVTKIKLKRREYSMKYVDNIRSYGSFCILCYGFQVLQTFNDLNN